jgi:hypothetical protein
MNAEKLLIYLRDCVKKLDESSEDLEFEPIILPTTGDPTKVQNKVSFIIMEQVGDDTKPKFIVHVEDLEALRKEKYG